MRLRTAALAILFLVAIVAVAYAATPTATVDDVTATTIKLGSLRCNTNYRIRLQTRSSSGTLSYTQTINQRTKPCELPPPPPDADGDGVPDSSDQCPDTAAGAQVDANGCLVENPPPPPADSDGDGVPDSSDQCPGTPQGVAVDANGCPVETPPPPPPVNEPAPIAGQGYSEVFRDDFDGTALNPANWWNHVFWQPNPGLVTVHDGMVSIQNRRSDGFPGSVDISTGPQWDGGTPLHSWTFGYLEARMRVTDAKGAWGAFWMSSVAHSQANGCPEPDLNYELDIFEQQGDEPFTYYAGQHRNTNGYCGVADSTAQPPVWPQLPTRVQGEWHTYAVKWTPQTVSYYFDGQQVGSPQATLDSGDQAEFINLTMQACGWDSTNSCGSTTPDTLATDVDYVTVWQQ